MKSKIAIYPGSFDPLHKGHIQILKKALKLFDLIYLVVTNNPDKIEQSNLETRLNFAKEQLKNLPNIIVISNPNKLTGELAKELKANFLIRSARNITDFNYEIELAAGNKKINKNLETILIMPNYRSINYSSTLIRHMKKLKQNV
ncbi:pantetheine-phosphate adenylyltransferase [Mycoplasmopsis sturni]|uniref:pantetheine-phosphate adenylyltransferase n=1 Tax=Mycoplasmopsis sturni TaxID=39047 RepID=UPI00055F0511|nr:pantetheine-phosphate adenylyltransferase [Mycoplasmopsis sturni]